MIWTYLYLITGAANPTYSPARLLTSDKLYRRNYQLTVDTFGFGGQYKKVMLLEFCYDVAEAHFRR